MDVCEWMVWSVDGVRDGRWRWRWRGGGFVVCPYPRGGCPCAVTVHWTGGPAGQHSCACSQAALPKRNGRPARQVPPAALRPAQDRRSEAATQPGRAARRDRRAARADPDDHPEQTPAVPDHPTQPAQTLVAAARAPTADPVVPLSPSAQTRRLARPPAQNTLRPPAPTPCRLRIHPRPGQPDPIAVQAAQNPQDHPAYPGITETGISAQLLTKLVDAKAGDLDQLDQLKSYRDELIEARHRKIWGKTYKAHLNARKPRTPIMTGRFLRPSVLNGPLPRLAHQPLHISMMMNSRRKKRERRVAEHRHLKDKLDTVRQEHQFDSALGHDQSEAIEQEHNREVKGILDRLNDISRSFTLDKEREKKVYSRELLDKIEAARRRRPRVMEQRNRWKRIKTRMAELEDVVEDDPEGGRETAEGKRFRIPEPSFWRK